MKEENSALKNTLVIEGKEHPWDRDTIAAWQIAKLGAWDIAQGVIEVDNDNNERTLGADEIVELKPGHIFGKRHRWKRG
jgi:Multiubiquitin